MNPTNGQLFCYTANSGSLAASANIQKTITFDNDSDFILREVRTIGTGLTIQIQTSSGYLFQNNAFTSSVIGSGNNGIKTMDNPPKILRNTVLQITFANPTAGSLTDEIQFWGYKIK